MSNRWAGVRGWAGVGACSAEGEGARNFSFLGKKIGKLYFCAKVVSTFPLALFDHFLHDFQEKEIHIKKKLWPLRGLNS